MEGFCKEETNPFGPVQLYDAPGTADVVKFNAEPSHKGLFDETVGVGGIGLTVTNVVPAEPVQPFSVALTE